MFCGDFIDRGPQIRDVITIVRTMVEQQAAHAVMGNHEFNAIAYHTEKPNAPGHWFRDHSERHTKQHQATMDQLDATDLQKALDWFRQLPVALDLGTIRVVHACWDPQYIDILDAALTMLDRFGPEFLEEGLNSNHPTGIAVERVLKGPEAALPDNVTVVDKEGHVRRRVRIRWFESPAGQMLGTYCFPGMSRLDEVPVPENAQPCPYPSDAVPLFIGHYWLKNDQDPLLLPNLACLDLSVAKGGELCGYRFNGESHLLADSLVRIPARTHQAVP